MFETVNVGLWALNVTGNKTALPYITHLTPLLHCDKGRERERISHTGTVNYMRFLFHINPDWAIKNSSKQLRKTTWNCFFDNNKRVQLSFLVVRLFISLG